jgi:hypothetical protein
MLEALVPCGFSCYDIEELNLLSTAPSCKELGNRLSNNRQRKAMKRMKAAMKPKAFTVEMYFCKQEGSIFIMVQQRIAFTSTTQNLFLAKCALCLMTLALLVVGCGSASNQLSGK